MKKTKGKKIIAFFMLIVLIVIGFDMPIKPTIVIAAATEGDEEEIQISCNGEITDAISVYAQYKQKLQCFIGGEAVTASNGVTCKWEILNGAEYIDFLDDNGNASNTTTVLSPYLYPKEVGEAEIILTVTKNGKEYPQKSLKVTITKKTLMIDHSNHTDPNFRFEYIYEDDATEALMISWNDTGNDYGSGNLNLLDASQTDKTGITWYSSDEDIAVVTVVNDIVTVKGIGAGHATISVQNAAGEIDSIDVYVKPKITVSGQKSNTYNITNGTTLETGVVYNTKVTELLTQKISWAVYKYDTNNQKIFIRDSLGNVGEDADVFQFSEVDGTPARNLRVNAKSGQYHVYFYPADTYNGLENSEYFAGNNSNTTNKDGKKCLVEPVVVQLNVTNATPSTDLTLNIGDAYDVASGLNITVEELNEWFVKPTISDSAVIEYHADTAQISAIGITDNIAIEFKPIQEQTIKNKIKAVLGQEIAENGITFNIRVIDYFSLNSKVSLKLGETMKLLPNYSNNPEYNYEWTSSDESSVSVTQDGWITGLKVTTEDVIITVSLKQNNEVIKRATCSVQVTTADSTLKLNKTETTINVGDTERITASITPASNDSVIYWSIEDESIATIAENKEGKYVDVTAVSPGTTVLAVMNSDNYVLAFCKITVAQLATGITLDQTQVTVKLDREIVRLKATLTPGNVTSTELEWTSTDTDVAVVDETGLVTLKSAGTTYITVKPKESASDLVRAECRLTVIQSADSITLNEKELSLKVGAQSKIEYTISPEKASTVITWNSLDTAVATVDNEGMVTAVGVGKTYITAVTEEGHVATCLVNVTQQATDVILDVTDVTLYVGDTYTVNYTLDPADSTEAGLTWTSQSEQIATVDSDGKITGVAPGSTTIFVKTKAGNVQYIFVTVVRRATGISFKEKELSLNVGEESQIEYTLLPEDAATAIIWNSLDTAVASVNDAGVVTAVAVGQTYVTAVTEEGYVAMCLIKVTQQATGVVINDTELTLDVGDIYTVNYTLQPEDSTESGLTWTSQSQEIATVDEEGRITAIAPGTTTILVKTKTGEVEYIFVTVIQSVKGLSLNKDTVTIAKGETAKLKAVITPENATNTNVIWKSSNTSVAKVSSAGKITGKSGGTAVITCTTEDGNLEANCIVTVTELVTKITLNKSSYKLGVGKSVTLKATVKSTSATNQTIKWVSSNTKIAKVTTTGKVTGKKVGTCTIKAKATDGSGVVAKCKIRVVRQATSVKLNKMYVKMYVGASYTLEATIKPKNASIKKLNWSSSNSDIVKVGTTGKMVALSVGRATITAKAKDNSNKKATCVIDVIERVPVTSISATETSVIMVKGTSQSLAFNVSPSTTTDTITYSSDNSAVATVNSNGMVRAKKVGTANIVARSTSGKSATVAVTVVGLNKTSITLEQYSTDQLWLNGDIGLTVKWSSENSEIARVDSSGNVTARRLGTTRIIATVKGVELYCTVKVINIPSIK